MSRLNQLRKTEQLLAAIEERQAQVLQNFGLVDRAARDFVGQLELIEEQLQRLPSVEGLCELTESARELSLTLEAARA